MASLKASTTRIETKVDKINGQVGENREAIAGMTTQVDNNQEDIKTLFRADEKLRDELRGAG